MIRRAARTEVGQARAGLPSRRPGRNRFQRPRISRAASAARARRGYSPRSARSLPFRVGGHAIHEIPQPALQFHDPGRYRRTTAKPPLVGMVEVRNPSTHHRPGVASPVGHASAPEAGPRRAHPASAAGGIAGDNARMTASADDRHEFRPGFEFDVGLGGWLRDAAARVPRAAGRTTVQRWQSNPTLPPLRAADRRYVLRRKPLARCCRPPMRTTESSASRRCARRRHRRPSRGGARDLHGSRGDRHRVHVMQHVEGASSGDPALPEVARDARAGGSAAWWMRWRVCIASRRRRSVRWRLRATGGLHPRQISRWARQYAGDAEAAGRVETMGTALIEWLPRHLPAHEPAAPSCTATSASTT